MKAFLLGCLCGFVIAFMLLFLYCALRIRKEEDDVLFEDKN